MAKVDIPIRAVIEAPPPGVRWAFQRSKGNLSDLVAPSTQSAERLVFEFVIRGEQGADGGLRLLGPGVQGPPTGRFFYLNSGTYAGQPSPYGRRAKVPLGGITAELAASLKPGQVLEVRFPGTGKDGGPTCASIRLPTPGWKIV